MPSFRFHWSWILILCVAFVIRPQRVAESTCGGWYPEYTAYSFFKPLSFSEYTAVSRGWDSTHTDNLREWRAYFQMKPKTEDISKIVYEASAEDMQKIRAFVEGKSTKLGSTLQSNSLVRYWQTNKDLNAIDYLYYAKVCEPEAQHYDSWDGKERDAEKMKWLADAGKKYYAEKGSNDFLKLRFAYQAIRMAHYSKQFQKTIDFYAELVNPLLSKTGSIIKYWAMAHQAGAMRRLGKNAEAAYWFSVVFEQCPSKRISSYLSFKIENEQDWQNALNLCQNNQEKTNLYFMRSLSKNADGLAEMQQVYRLAPESDKMLMMLLREINKAEHELLDIDLNQNLLFFTDYKSFPKAEAVRHLQELKKFTTQCVAENKVTRPDFWALSSAYLDHLAGNPAQARQKFAALKSQSKDKSFKQQIEICELAITLSSLRQIDANAENELYNQVKATKHEHLEAFMFKTFERLLAKQGETGKAFLCHQDIYTLRVNPKPELVDNLIQLAEKKEKTAFEQDLIFNKITLSEYQVGAKSVPVQLLMEVKATLLFGQDRLNEAIALYQQIPENLIYKIAEDPLAMHITDCQECPSSLGKGKYNRLTLAQKIANLKKLAEKPGIDQAKQLLQLGAAYYNMSFFGSSWIATDYFRSPTDFSYAHAQDEKEKADWLESYVSFDCSKAKYYFERAMNAANTQGDKETAAQACFMAAKCEQNLYYMNPMHKDMWAFIEPTYAPEYRRNFAMLKKEYSKTKYFKEVKQTCAYFNEFLKR